MAKDNVITPHQALIMAAMEIHAANIRGFRPTTTERLLKEIEEEKDPRGLSATWEWSWAAEAHLSVDFDWGTDGKQPTCTPRVRVNWPATSRSPIEGQVSLQLYQLVVDLACRIEMMLSRHVVRPAKK